MLIRLGYSQQMWSEGVKSPFTWDTNKVPHVLISGITGGGKTVLSQILVNQLLKEDCEIYICDFKAGGDWNGIVDRYAEYLDCDLLLNEYYEDFCLTIERKGHKESFLVFDEFSSYALSKDSKEQKDMLAKVSHIAFMGRSFGYHLIFISQQFNAKVLDTAIREQFGIKIYMGSTISTESATMLFPIADIDKSVHLPRFCGYISTPESDGVEVIQIPYIEQPCRLKDLLIYNGKTYGKRDYDQAGPRA